MKKRLLPIIGFPIVGLAQSNGFVVQLSGGLCQCVREIFMGQVED